MFPQPLQKSITQIGKIVEARQNGDVENTTFIHFKTAFCQWKGKWLLEIHKIYHDLKGLSHEN